LFPEVRGQAEIFPDPTQDLSFQISNFVTRLVCDLPHNTPTKHSVPFQSNFSGVDICDSNFSRPQLIMDNEIELGSSIGVEAN
jgi:hypothetical protein